MVWHDGGSSGTVSGCSYVSIHLLRIGWGSAGERPSVGCACRVPAVRLQLYMRTLSSASWLSSDSCRDSAYGQPPQPVKSSIWLSSKSESCKYVNSSTKAVHVATAIYNRDPGPRANLSSQDIAPHHAIRHCQQPGITNARLLLP